MAGAGLYKSTDGGDTWTGPLGKPVGGKGIGEIVVKPGDSEHDLRRHDDRPARHVRVCCTGVTRPVPDAAQWGLYKSTDGGATWTFIHNGSANAADCTGRSDRVQQRRRPARRAACAQVVLDPSDPDIVYAGVVRSRRLALERRRRNVDTDQSVAERRGHPDAAAIAVTTANGKTRMYVYEGNTGQPYSPAVPQRRRRDRHAGVHRPDQHHTSPTPVGRPTTCCTGQCWYDQFVVHPEGLSGHRVRRRFVLVRRDRSPTSGASCCRPTPASPEPT